MYFLLSLEGMDFYMIKKLFNKLPTNMKLTLTCVGGLLIIGLMYL